MAQKFDLDELNDLPPAQRMERIKALKKQIDDETKKIETETQKQLEDEQKSLDLLLKQQAELERLQREQASQQNKNLEQSIKNTPEEQKQPPKEAIEYSFKGNAQYQKDTSTKEQQDVPFGAHSLGPKSMYDNKKDYLF